MTSWHPGPKILPAWWADGLGHEPGMLCCYVPRHTKWVHWADSQSFTWRQGPDDSPPPGQPHSQEEGALPMPCREIPYGKVCFYTSHRPSPVVPLSANPTPCLWLDHPVSHYHPSLCSDPESACKHCCIMCTLLFLLLIPGASAADCLSRGRMFCVYVGKGCRLEWVWVLSKFNGTSTPKGSYRAKTGDNDCNVNSSLYSLSTALCESIRYQVKSEQNVREDLITRVRHGEAALCRLEKA